MDDFFKLDEQELKRLVDEELPGNDISFFAVLGWAQFDQEGRRQQVESLLEPVVLELLDPDSIRRSGIKANFPLMAARILRSIEDYRGLSLQERISYWSCRWSPPPPKWPQMQVVCSAGYFEKLLSCRCPPANRWQKLTAKPEKLLSKSLGSRYEGSRPNCA